MSGLISRDFIELLLSRIDIVDLINVQVKWDKKTNQNYFARCPFHTEKSASFSVSQQKQFYYCFGCGAHGNAIDFLMQHDRLSFPEAIEQLARIAGMEVPKTNQPHAIEIDHHDLYDFMATIAQYYYDHMRRSTRAIDYLKQRHISGTMAQQFMIGYAPDGWSHLLDQFGKNDSDKKKLLTVGLIIPNQHGGYYDRFRDRIMFPIQDYRGRIIGFGGRVIGDGEPKYLNSPETPLFHKGQELYGLYHLLKSQRKVERILLVEGYFDVIALFQNGLPFAAATLGTATTAQHLQRLLRYTTEIIFCFDGDHAGKTAAWRALQVVLPHLQDILQVRFLFLPDGEDPDSFIHREGAAAFEKRIQEAPSLSTFFFQTLYQQNDLSSLEGRAKFANQALHSIKQLPAGLLQTMMLEELSKRARIDLKNIQKEIKPVAATLTPVEPEIAYDASAIPAPIKKSLALLLQQPQLALAIDQPFFAAALPGQTLLVQLIDFIKKNPQIHTGLLLEYWRDQKAARFITDLAFQDPLIPDEGLKNEFLGALRQINLLELESEISRLLSKASQENLTEAEKRLLSEYIARKKNLSLPIKDAFQRS